MKAKEMKSVQGSFPKRIKSFALLGISTCFLLSACGGTDVSISSKNRNPTHPKVSKMAVITSSEGTYKIGTPYKISGVWYTPKEEFDYVETGVASWYGADFHNGVTANGEIYNMHSMTAAHRTLPLPSIVKVTNLKNGKSVKLRVNDRGPFAKDRIIDVSRLAAQKLGFMNDGTTKVRVEIIADESIALKNSICQASGKFKNISRVSASKLEPTPVKQSKDLSKTYGLFVQAGAFSDRNNADKVRSDIDALDGAKLYQSGISRVNNVYRVRIGPFTTRREAEKVLAEVRKIGYPESRIFEDE